MVRVVIPNGGSQIDNATRYKIFNASKFPEKYFPSLLGSKKPHCKQTGDALKPFDQRCIGSHGGLTIHFSSIP
jgi:hypothetical protein